MYMSIRQASWNGPVFLLRAHGDPPALLGPVRAALAELDPSIPLYDPTTVRELLAEGLAGRRLPVVRMATFGALALLLASVGVHAMFAAMAAAREREFGMRVALGSSRGAIAGSVLRQGAGWMALGLAGGAVGVRSSRGSSAACSSAASRRSTRSRAAPQSRSSSSAASSPCSCPRAERPGRIRS